ncbi:MAG TPA: tetratricopeptide repeat protein [Thermoanaerobaculia bacterium]|nr:tetratricopeptide repeat protein [Thermoanaerobaculia bacterium]
MLAAFGTGAIVLAAVLVALKQADRPVTLEAVTLSSETRPSVARLSGYPFWPVRASNEPARPNLSLLAFVSRVATMSHTHQTAKALHDLGIAYLILGRADGAVATLEKAIQVETARPDVEHALIASRNVTALCDLSAAYFTQGEKGGARYAIVKALNAAERAWNIRRDPVAAWNRAIALHALKQNAAAARAWRDVQDVEPDPAWRREAVLLAKNERAAAISNDRPDLLRKEVVNTLIPAWAEALERGDLKKGDALMARAIVIGRQLQTRRHNGAVAALLLSLQGERQRQVLPLFTRLKLASKESSHARRSKILAATAAAFKRVGSPYGRYVAVAATREAFYANELEQVHSLCHTWLREVDERSDPAVQGELRWLNALSLLATGGAGEAVLSYEGAVTELTSVGEGASAAGALARLAEAEDYIGASSDAWDARVRSLGLALAAGDSRTFALNTYAAAAAAADAHLPFAALALSVSIEHRPDVLRVDVPLLRANVLRDLGETERACLNIAAALEEAERELSAEVKARFQADAELALGDCAAKER